MNTPPARVALCNNRKENPSLSRAETMSEAMQLPAKAYVVFVTMSPRSNVLFARSAELKAGQQSHRKNVPRRESTADR